MKIVDAFRPLAILQKSFIVDVSQDSRYDFVQSLIIARRSSEKKLSITGVTQGNLVLTLSPNLL